MRDWPWCDETIRRSFANIAGVGSRVRRTPAPCASPCHASTVCVGPSRSGSVFAPANGITVQLLALGVLIAGGGIVYLAVAAATGAANYRSLWRSVARG